MAMLIYTLLPSPMRRPPRTVQHTLLVAEHAQDAGIGEGDESPARLDAPARRATTEGGFGGEETAASIAWCLF